MWPRRFGSASRTTTWWSRRDATAGGVASRHRPELGSPHDPGTVLRHGHSAFRWPDHGRCADLSRQDHQVHRAVHARVAGRRRRPRDRAGFAEAARPERHPRSAIRRRQRDRDQGRRGGRARRLHIAADRHAARFSPHHVSERRRRGRQRPRADRIVPDLVACHRRGAGNPGQDAAGARGLCQSQSGQARLGLRARQHAAHPRRVAEAGDRHRHRLDSVSRRRSGARRPARRPRAHEHRAARRHAAADPGGQGAAAGLHRARAQRRSAGRADHEGSGLSDGRLRP